MDMSTINLKYVVTIDGNEVAVMPYASLQEDAHANDFIAYEEFFADGTDDNWDWVEFGIANGQTGQEYTVKLLICQNPFAPQRDIETLDPLFKKIAMDAVLKYHIDSMSDDIPF